VTSREAVLAAFAFEQPAYTPSDYFGTPEIHQGLLRHFGVRADDELGGRLGTDIRLVNPPYVGPAVLSMGEKPAAG